MFNRQQKTVTTNTVHGSSSSSSSSSVTRTFFSTSTSYHSESSANHFHISTNNGNPSVLETIKRIERLSIDEPTNKIVSRNPDNFPTKKSVAENIEKFSINQPSDKVFSRNRDNFETKKSDSAPISRNRDNFETKKSDPAPKSAVETHDKFERDCLIAHNDYRRKHGVGPLTLNPALSKFAQNWANTIAKKRRMEHSSERKYGENIYWSSGKAVNGKLPVDSWYDEIKQYSYKNASFSSGTGHFTQVVWKSTTELGVGVACVGDEVYVVASYYPPGNYSGEFSKNVFPPK